MTAPQLSSRTAYSNRHDVVHLQGWVVNSESEFREYLQTIVKPRVRDEDSAFTTEIHGLATTKMETEFVARVLRSVPSVQGWEVGEALAECVLQHDTNLHVVWPWNTIRDRRTPRASLPGADLVGFCADPTNVRLLFGEVKTSSDTHSPPRVLSGDKGMLWQLEEISSRLDIHHTLLKWLHARCTSKTNRHLYRSAISRYLNSGGKELLLVGVLIRDTPPNEHDFETHAKKLATRVRKPTDVELLAWYLPIKISDWTALMEDAS